MDDASVTIRPRKIRRVAWALAPVVVVFFVVLGTLLTGPTGDGEGTFQRSDQVAMMILGLFGAAGILLLARPKITADATHVVIKNVIGGYDLPWNVVRAVRFERGNPWATLELEDDDVVSILAIQATDKEHAVTAIRTLRNLMATAHATPTATPTATA